MPKTHLHSFAALSVLALAAGIAACAGSNNEVAQAPMAPAPSESAQPAPAKTSDPPPAASANGDRGGASRGQDQSDAVASVARGPDNLKGNGPFSLADATAGMTGSGAYVATITTSMGALKCSLFDTKAPVTVANFIGLARGTRPWKNPDDGVWQTRPAYDGTTFHRIIKGFMIQGGDPTGTGAGEPGYTIADEAWPGASHDRAGLLCMANRGPNTNGMQFFITDASTPHLDRGKTAYTIFGECAPESVVHAIANVPVGVADRPTKQVQIVSVTISRANP